MRLAPPNIATFPNGNPIAVGRPSNPALAVELAKEGIGKNDPDLFARIEKLCGPYVFVGYLSKQTCDGESTVMRPDGASLGTGLTVLVDHEGKEIGHCEPGDSFIEVTDDAPFAEIDEVF